MAKVGVLGAGSWGTALAILLHDNGHDVTVWSIDPKEVEMLSEKREHVLKLPGVHISEEIMITNEMEEAIKGKDFLVLAVPSIFTRSTAAKMKPYVVDGQMIVDVAKGIEEDTLMTLSQQINPTGGCGSSFRTDTCGRGRKKASDFLCDRSEDKRDSRVLAVCI